MSEAQAQNKLGELFVDIGVGGLGKTLKALNSVSASFLLTKNAATQAITPLLNMTKEGASLATALSKVSAETGLAQTKLLALKRFSDLNNVSFETLAGTIEGLQQKILGAKMGTDTASMQAFQLMGLNPLELSEKDPVKAFDEIKQRVQTLSPEVQTMALNLLGMNKELTYVYKQINGSLEDNLNNIQDTYKTSDEQLKNLEEQQKNFNKIKVATDQIKINIASWKVSQDFIKAVADLTSDIAKRGFDAALTDFFNNTKPVKKEQLDDIKAMKKANATNIVNYTDKDGKKLSKKEIKKLQSNADKIIKEAEKEYFENKAKKTKTENTEILGAAPIQPNGNINNGTIPTLPNAAATTTNNTTSTVNVNNYWNNQFEIMGDGSAEQAYQIQEYLNQQQNLAEYTNTPHI